MGKRLSKCAVIAGEKHLFVFTVGRFPFETNILMLHRNDNKIEKRVAARKTTKPRKALPNISRGRGGR